MPVASPRYPRVLRILTTLPQHWWILDPDGVVWGSRGRERTEPLGARGRSTSGRSCLRSRRPDQAINNGTAARTLSAAPRSE
jgi:hypothetical protein